MIERNRLLRWISLLIYFIILPTYSILTNIYLIKLNLSSASVVQSATAVLAFWQHKLVIT